MTRVVQAPMATISFAWFRLVTPCDTSSKLPAEHKQIINVIVLKSWFHVQEEKVSKYRDVKGNGSLLHYVDV